ncbi:DNA polymerase IV [Calidifontibacter sp. DB0510]|uniref:DNA polymerase IV n=1 Tax=Metallococcus carri TaxID=1656884 RepID=A0A967B2P3_9MICO|nr:DNA polymerase IV [Metallococcus carri]NHN56874.1 DNA polymerase IV [Metallococcus carri]NOP37619.1 DNA polymerase IV [Calidifontibacter sp. DB2511S]
MFVSAANILHADLDSFYASVEQRDDPSLRGRPIAVGGGIVMAASYEARAYGVRGAMGERAARALCPDLVVVPMRFEAYAEASRAVFEVFRSITPLVEGISVDEAFLEVGGLRRLVGPPEMIAQIVRSRVRGEVGLPISVGVARTKFLAKIASAVCKPDGLLVVEPDGEEEFLHPLPVERLWGVGKVTAEKLHARGIRTVGELARLERTSLDAAVGKASGRHLFALAHLQDPRPVTTGRRRRSIGSQRALGLRPRSDAELDQILLGIADRVMGRVRDGGRPGRTVTLRVRFADFEAVTRSHTLPRPTTATETVVRVARELLLGLRPMIADRGITLLGLSIGGLDGSGAVQLPLPFGDEVPGALDGTLDEVRERFGSSAVRRGVLVGKTEGLSVPTLPDVPGH